MKIKSKTFAAAFAVAALAISFFSAFCVNNTAADTGDLYTLTVNVDGSGCSVTQNVTQDYYNYSDALELTPVAASGWSFSGWSGDLSGSDSPATVILASNMTINATFTQDSYALTIYTNGNGTVSPGNQTYLSGTIVNLQAINDENFTFSGWSGDVTGTANTTITMDGNKTVTANFTLTDDSPISTPTPAPSPTATPTNTPIATPTPSATASPSPAPTSTPSTAEASMGTYLPIIAAIVILLGITIALFARRKKTHSKLSNKETTETENSKIET